MLFIKGKEIGMGKPLVCVPVMATEEKDIVKQIIDLAQQNTDMVEWRLDAFANAKSMNAIRQVLEEVKGKLGNTILLATFRSKVQGGLLEVDHETLEDIHQVCAESKVVDLVDIELFESEHAKREIEQLQKCGVKIVASHHDFDKTPEAEVIQMLLEQMKDSGADIVKIAMMPKDIEDVLLVLSETARFHKKYPDTPLVTMSMGAKGGISRVSGEFFGSCITFGAGEVASAPGQLPNKELEEILEILHRSIK